MKVQIRARNVEVTEVLRARVLRRLGFALDRFGDRIARVTVRLSDTNGPLRGGIDKRCQIDIGMRTSPNVRAEHTSTDWFTTIDRAAERAARSVARVCARERESSVGVPREVAR